MFRAYLVLFLLLTLLFAVGVASGQVATGTPPFGSFTVGPEVINLANLNLRLTIPVRHKAGRGTDFSYDLVYDSLVWKSSGGGWQPVSNWGWTSNQQSATGTISYYGQPMTCFADGAQDFIYYVFFYADAYGVTHAFSLTTPLHRDPNCGAQFTTQIATDGSGLKITAQSCGVSCPISATITTTSGQLIIPTIQGQSPPTTLTKTDRNGNQIGLNTSGVFTDTLGTTALTVTGSGSPASPYVFTYTAPSGASATVKVNYTQYTVNTYFQVSGIAEYGRTSVALVSSVVLPDHTQYSFAYEPTPGGAGCTPLSGTTQCVTARVASVTLPTGGSISYSYSGGNNGIFSDGSTATLTRTTPDGTWIYSQTKGTGAASTTTITDPERDVLAPNGNQTVIQFQGIYETQRQIYQGLTSGTLLETVNTCYNGSSFPCTTTAVSLPITRRIQLVALPDNTGRVCKHDQFFDSYGLLTEQDDYDYGSGAPATSPLRKIVNVYNRTLTNGIVSMPASVTICTGTGTSSSCNGTGTEVAQTTLAYDETAVTATSGTPQHLAVSGSRGNATTVKRWRFRLFSGRRSQIETPAVEVNRVNEILFVPESPSCVFDPLDLRVERFARSIGDAMP